MKDNDLHGSGLKLVNMEGVQLAINREASASGKVKCHFLFLSDG